jgi:hypothetical protein
VYKAFNAPPQKKNKYKLTQVRSGAFQTPRFKGHQKRPPKCNRNTFSF